ncbi:hypothetical protein XENOCAPTIV_018520 [Xenoophorus captivus]|uniref:Secreted protein n=1 Tax=Xenoophorus captivus TaxID=1517983 RepID=A0ABV0QEP3_9TELE
MWHPADAPPSGPLLLTWPLALAAAGSAAALPSTSTPPLDNWAPIVFFLSNKKEKEHSKRKKNRVGFTNKKVQLRDGKTVWPGGGGRISFLFPSEDLDARRPSSLYI